MNNIPNKSIRSIILGLILVVFLGTTIYVAITKENNKLVGNRLEDIYYENLYDDDDNDYDYDDYNDYDDYDDYESDYYDEFPDGELELDSITVTSLYNYVSLYPYIEELKDNFKVTDLTKEEKMRLVAASLKSKSSLLSQPVEDVEEKTIIVNGKTYNSTTPNIRYKSFEVTMMYSEIFGSSTDFDYSVLMHDGDNVIYKYHESANGYIKYISENKEEITPDKPVIVKAERKNKKVELHLKSGAKTEVYIFEPKEGYNYLYKFIERKSEQTKNSL